MHHHQILGIFIGTFSGCNYFLCGQLHKILNFNGQDSHAFSRRSALTSLTDAVAPKNPPVLTAVGRGVQMRNPPIFLSTFADPLRNILNRASF